MILERVKASELSLLVTRYKGSSIFFFGEREMRCDGEHRTAGITAACRGWSAYIVIITIITNGDRDSAGHIQHVVGLLAIKANGGLEQPEKLAGKHGRSGTIIMVPRVFLSSPLRICLRYLRNAIYEEIFPVNIRSSSVELASDLWVIHNSTEEDNSEPA